MKLSATLALIAIFGATALPIAANAQQSRNSKGRFDQSRRDNDRNDRGNNRNSRDNDRDRRDRDRNWRDNDRNDRNDRNRWDNGRDWRDESDRRQQTKNEWRNIAIGAGALSLLGLLQGDNTLFFGGAAGSLYSLHRYEQDRKSQSKLDRARSQYFSRDHFYRDGVRFDRREVNKNGQRYYQFFRGR